MCMTSTKPIGGYAAQSALPYTEESPLPVCQWKELGSSSSSSSWATTTSATSSNETTPIVVSAWSSPTTAATSATSATSTIDTSTRLMQGMKRRRKLQELPLPLRKRTCHTPKERFAAFVTILLLHLDGGGNQLKRNFKLSVQAKALVAECCRRNQMGDAHFSPLQESLSERLHGLVGEAHWTRTREYLYIYLTRHFGFRPGQDEQEEDRQLLHIPSNTTTAVTATIRRNSTGPSK